MEGLVDGMNKASELYDAEEYFVTDVLLCSDAMYAGLDVLRPHLENTDDQTKKKAVIGVVEGDTHDIGKNLVKIMMETAGFEMYDLGRDVPLDQLLLEDVDRRLHRRRRGVPGRHARAGHRHRLFAVVPVRR